MHSQIGSLSEILFDLKTRKSNFLNQCCKSTSEILMNLGFEFREGLVLIEGIKRGHCWNYDPSTEKYIDLTLYQFDIRIPEIFIVKADSDLAKEIYIPL